MVAVGDRVRVVAVDTVEVAALHEDHEPVAGSVDRREAEDPIEVAECGVHGSGRVSSLGPGHGNSRPNRRRTQLTSAFRPLLRRLRRRTFGRGSR